MALATEAQRLRMDSKHAAAANVHAEMVGVKPTGVPPPPPPPPPLVHAPT